MLSRLLWGEIRLSLGCGDENGGGLMDQVIFCGIDGCLTKGKGAALDMPRLAEIKGLIRQLADRNIGFCLSTGRPQPYAELIGQILGLDTPMICENGGVVFDPVSERAAIMVSENKIARMAKLRRKMVGGNYIFELGHEASIRITWKGIAHASLSEIVKQRDSLAEHFAKYGLKWTNTHASIDVTPRRVSKRSGAAFVLELLELEPINAFAIGDCHNDLKILGFVEVPMCPANASDEVLQVCGAVASQPDATGVAELLQGILDMEAAE